jgi:F420-dependent oxidoreductase-like protein
MLPLPSVTTLAAKSRVSWREGMRIGLTAWGSTVDDLVEHAWQAERDGFASVWYSYLSGGDPLVTMALAGRRTSSIELGTAVLQTYPCHPLLQANRVSAVTSAMNRPGLTLGIGPSHPHIVEGVYGLKYDHPGRSTEEYVRILTGLLAGQPVDFEGEDWSTHSERRFVPAAHPVAVLLSALSPRLLRVAGEYTDGTILWLATAAVVESHVTPRVRAAAAGAGRPAPRIVAGLPVAVHDDVAEARGAATISMTAYAGVPNYQRILELGGTAAAGDVAIVGNAASVRRQLQALLDAGATDIWAGIFPVGDDPAGSLARTYEALGDLVG